MRKGKWIKRGYKRFCKWFFGKPTTIADTLKYVGAIIGGILLVVNVIYINKQTKEQNRSNNLVVKGQLDTRFKDAATLLASGNTSAELSAIHALHQIAVEASQTEDQKDYVRVIKDILEAFIKENSVIKYDESKRCHKSCEGCPKSIDTAYNIKSEIVLQTIIDKLFRDNGCKIYTKYSISFEKAVLKGIIFNKAQLQNVVFYQVQLQNAQFDSAQLQNVDFISVGLQNVMFHKTQLQNVKFYKAQLQNAFFANAHNIDKVIFWDTFWDKNTNFTGTAFENKTIEELTKIMGRPPEPLEE